MELTLGPEVISSYKRLAYQPWYALAEFVDNSTQAYFNNSAVMDKVFKEEKSKLTVCITHGTDERGPFIRIEDNSVGMSEQELSIAVCIGKPPLDTRGRSRYGLGLKTGASWFGDLWTIETSKLGENVKHKITVDVVKIAKNQLDLHHTKTAVPAGTHGTIIEIRKLHRSISARVLAKTKEHLKSLYRRDINKGKLVLKVNSSILEWSVYNDKQLIQLEDGTIAKSNFSFKVGTKKVTGWAGVLEKGSRRMAGFSLLQSDRVIYGWPESYRPDTIFGKQEGGTNDLVNQRLCGEIVLEGFEVSHTKDRILFEDGEQDILESKLKTELAALRALALSYRKNRPPPKVVSEATYAVALNQVEQDISSQKLLGFLETFEVPPTPLIKRVKTTLLNGVVARHEPSFKAKLGKLELKIYLVSDMSPNDPYVLIEAVNIKDTVIIIINAMHPHWMDLTHPESVVNFIRHCAYDGVAEAKAFALTGKLEGDTIKLIKDNLLRLRLDIQ